MIFTLALLLPACSLSRAPLVAVRLDDAGPRLDAPAPSIDAPIPPGVDAPIPPGLDAPPTPVDSPSITPIDAPVVPDTPACVPGCETVTVVRTCTGPNIDCALNGMTCNPSTAACAGPPCVEGRVECSPDGRASLRCTSGARVPTLCDAYNCDTDTGLCDAQCNRITSTFTPGTHTFDVCSYGADFENNTGPGCMAGADGEDRMARIVVSRPSRLDARARDDDGGASIDVVLYLRGGCDDAGSQIACADDVPCAEAFDMTTCIRGNQWREAHLVRDLDPGVYYLTVDSIDTFTESIDWECGDVSLTVTLTPL